MGEIERRYPICIESHGKTWEGARIVTGKRVLRQRVESQWGSKSDPHSYSGSRIAAMDGIARLLLHEIVSAFVRREQT